MPRLPDLSAECFTATGAEDVVGGKRLLPACHGIDRDRVSVKAIDKISPDKRSAGQSQKPLKKQGFASDSVAVKDDGEKPPGRFELPTYALRMRRSAS